MRKSNIHKISADRVSYDNYPNQTQDNGESCVLIADSKRCEKKAWQRFHTKIVRERVQFNIPTKMVRKRHDVKIVRKRNFKK